MAAKSNQRERIVDAALELADGQGWEAVRLFDVANAAGISLDDIRAHFREKEDLVDAWFDRADQAMLQAATQPEVKGLPPKERIHRLIMVWLETLAPHRRVTRDMILGRLEPGHLHVQFPALLRISRTVQWLREGARRDATFVRRALEETVLTSIYVTTFCYWLRDDSDQSRNTRRLLDRLLGAVEPLDRCCGSREHRPHVEPAQPSPAA